MTTLLLLLLLLSPSFAQPYFHSFQNPADSLRTKALVESFFRLASGSMVPHDSVESYAIDAFAVQLQKVDTVAFWPAGTTGSVERIHAVGDDDAGAVVTAVTKRDSVPFFGPMSVDWVFFLRRNDRGKWRISELRRMSGTGKALRTLQFLDTSTTYPAALKKAIVQETTTILFSNAQLREHFASNRNGFQALLAQFQRHDSLKMLGRTDRLVLQLNTHGIYWGIAAEEVPKEAIDEYMKTATPEQRKFMKAQLDLADRLRRDGRDTLLRLAKKAKLAIARIDSTIGLMKDLRAVFVNAMLPWRDAVQITLAGDFPNAMGYLYSPTGELPLIDPNEYYYLEEIGDGWWIFRAT
jgi:hypothetical protein